MKKLFWTTAFLLLMTAAFSQETSFNFAKYNRFSLGGGANVGDSFTSGFVDLGFSWFSKNGFDIRNYVKIQGGGYASGGMFLLREQLVFAETFAITSFFGVRAYGFVDFGFGIFENKEKAFFDVPFLMEARGGGGVELLINGGGIFIEAGGGGRFSTSGSISRYMADVTPGMGFVSVGGRAYF